MQQATVSIITPAPARTPIAQWSSPFLIYSNVANSHTGLVVVISVELSVVVAIVVMLLCLGKISNANS